MKILGVVLVIVGIVALIYAGVGSKRQIATLEVGGIKATATERKSSPMAPVVGVVGLIGGIVLLAMPAQRPR